MSEESQECLVNGGNTEEAGRYVVSVLHACISTIYRVESCVWYVKVVSAIVRD